jgi:hypothetical protein
MKAEERKHLKENELATRLAGMWQTVASGSTTNTIIWGVIFVGLAVTIGWRYFANASLANRSAEWFQVEQAASDSELEQLIKDHPGTVVARIASFRLNRHQMEDALSRLAGPASEDRTKAAETLVKVRDRYIELSKDSAAEPTLIQEALMGTAKAEEVLAGVPKADNPKTGRGSLDVAQKAYDDLAKRYPDSYLGKEAAKRAQELRDHGDRVLALYNALLELHGKPTGPPELPPAPVIPGTSLPGPTLPEAPKAPENPPPAAAPAPADKQPAPPAKPAVPPNPPASNPAGISPAEAPKDQKPKGP